MRLKLSICSLVAAATMLSGGQAKCVTGLVLGGARCQATVKPDVGVPRAFPGEPETFHCRCVRRDQRSALPMLDWPDRAVSHLLKRV